MIVSWCKVDKSGKALKSGTFLTGDGVRYPRKGIFNFKNHTSWQKLRSVNHFVFLNFYFGAKNARHGNSLVLCRVSQGRIIIVLFWTKYAVPRQFKPGILKITTSRGKRNLLTVFIFVSFEEKGCYRIVSLGHQNFDCRSYCGLRRRMKEHLNGVQLCPDSYRRETNIPHLLSRIMPRQFFHRLKSSFFPDFTEKLVRSTGSLLSLLKSLLRDII